jgi:sulfoquinovosidase
MSSSREPWVVTPGDLLARADAYALAGAIAHRQLLSWTFFRREVTDRHRLELPDRRSFRLSAPEGYDRVELHIPIEEHEHLTGFGERFNAVDQRGWRIESWTEEGVAGFGERVSPWLTRLGVAWHPFPKGPTATYKPLPWVLSSRGWGLLLQTHAPVWFDVGASRPDRLVAEVAAAEVDVTLFTDAQPDELVTRLTERTGRPPGLPDWALAPWLDAIGGQDEVRRVARLVRDRGIPAAAIWYEDWQNASEYAAWFVPFRYERLPLGWLPRRFRERVERLAYYRITPAFRRPDRSRYPDLEQLNDELRAIGMKPLAYYGPHIADVDDDFELARRNGWLISRSDGEPATYRVRDDRLAHVDLTHPDARAWYADELRRGLEYGFDGWMADFGEYTPVESRTFSGESGLEHHNRYPLLWAELNREVLRDERPDGAVFFSRSGSLGTQGVCPLVWTGDSNTDMERWDGLPSNVPAAITAGLSGWGVWAVDIGGYLSLTTRNRDRETFQRWTELAAFTAVMRTHHSTHPRGSVQFDHDEATLEHFRTYTRLHTALFPLRRALVDEAARTGLPVCRGLLLHHPDDDRAWEIVDQFLLGPDLLVAPVVERGADRRTVHLPPGDGWVDLWTATVHRGGQEIEVPAPIGRAPLFLRAAGAVATLDRHVDTLAHREAVSDPAVRTLDDVAGSLTVLCGPELAGTVQVAGGPVLTVVDAGAGGTTSPDLEERQRRPGASGEARHDLLPAPLVAAWTAVGATDPGGGRVPWHRDGELRVDDPEGRRITVLSTALAPPPGGPAGASDA